MRAWWLGGLIATSLAASCSLDWDRLDPSKGSTAGEGGSLGTTSAGGMGGTTSSTGGAGGAGGEAGGGGDGGSGGMEPLGPWGPVEVVVELSSDVDDDDPTMTADGLLVIINSTRGPTPNLFESTRANGDAPWSDPVSIDALNSDFTDTNPTLSPDGLTIWFQSERDAMLGRVLYTASRPSRASAWSTPVLAADLVDQGIVDVFGVTSDGLTMLASGPQTGSTTALDVYLLERPTTASSWGTAVRVDELSTGADDNEGWLSPDGLVAWNATNVAGGVGLRDFWSSSRADVALPFDPLVNVVELNSTATESDAALTADQRYILFTMDRGGSREIVEARR